MTHIIENKKTGQTLGISTVNVDSFTFYKNSYSYLKVLNIILKNPASFVAPILDTLTQLETKLTGYKKLMLTNRADVFPILLCDTIDANSSALRICSDLNVFTSFYEHTKSIQSDIDKIQQFFKAHKPYITSKLSEPFKQLEHTDYHIEFINKDQVFGLFTKPKKAPTTQRPTWVLDKCSDDYVPKIMAQHKAGAFPWYNPNILEAGLLIDLFNFYDAIFLLSSKNPVQKIITSEVFNHSLSDYQLKQAPSIQVPLKIPMYAIAVRTPARIPEDGWLHRTGHGNQNYFYVVDDISMASAYLNLEEAKDVINKFKGGNKIQTAIVSFESVVLCAQLGSGNSVDLKNTLSAHIDKQLVNESLGVQSLNDALTTESSSTKRLKI